MSRPSWNRLTAWFIDWLCILAWVGLTAAVGVPLYLSGVTANLGTGPLNVIATLVVVVPVTLALAKMEAGPREATVGKRLRGLRVVQSGSGFRASFRQTLLRNALKVTLPWSLGHWIAFELSRSTGRSVAPWMWAATALAYVLPVIYVASLFRGRGITPYDRISHTVVVNS